MNYEEGTEEENVAQLVNNWSTNQPLIRFRQSPYVMEDIIALSEKSRFYSCRLDNPSDKLDLIYEYGVET